MSTERRRRRRLQTGSVRPDARLLLRASARRYVNTTHIELTFKHKNKIKLTLESASSSSSNNNIIIIMVDECKFDLQIGMEKVCNVARTSGCSSLNCRARARFIEIYLGWTTMKRQSQIQLNWLPAIIMSMITMP